MCLFVNDEFLDFINRDDGPPLQEQQEEHAEPTEAASEYRKFDPGRDIETPRGGNDPTPHGPPMLPVLTLAWLVPGDTLQLTFTTEFGRAYMLQSSADLRPGSWQALSAMILGTGEVVELSLAAPIGARQFFRVAILETP